MENLERFALMMLLLPSRILGMIPPVGSYDSGVIVATFPDALKLESRLIVFPDFRYILFAVY